MKMLKSTFVIIYALVFISSISSCGFLLGAKRADKEFFVLNDLHQLSYSQSVRTQKSILVRPAKANGFINSRKIIFSDNPSVRSYYQLAQWVEPPADRWTLLLTERLRKSEGFTGVALLGSSSLGELQINTELLEFYHDTSNMPGKVLVRVNGELIDTKNREIIAQKQFTKTLDVESYSAQGAVDAFSKAVSEILDEISLWVLDKAKNLK